METGRSLRALALAVGIGCWYWLLALVVGAGVVRWVLKCCGESKREGKEIIGMHELEMRRMVNCKSTMKADCWPLLVITP
jgi:hypothetical protein